jgi:hypothetical protein
MPTPIHVGRTADECRVIDINSRLVRVYPQINKFTAKTQRTQNVLLFSLKDFSAIFATLR